MSNTLPHGRFAPPSPFAEEPFPREGGRLLRGLSRTSLILTLLAAPWLFGGTEPDVEFRLYGGLMVALALWVASLAAQRIRTGRLAVSIPWLVLPVLLGIGVGAWQWLTPAVRSVSRPALASSLSDSASGNSPTPAESLPAFQGARTLSPAATRVQIARLVGVATALLLGAALFPTLSTVRWLWGPLAINGGALAFFGLIQLLSWNGRLFWSVPLRHQAPAFASFVNRNNAAGYLALGLAAAIGLFLMVRRSSDYDDRDQDWSDERDPGRWSPWPLFSFGLMVLIATGIVATASRGGMLALGGAGVLVIGLLFFKGNSRAVASVGGGFLVLSLLLGAWVGLGERTGERWKSVSADTFSAGGRWSHWQDSFRAVQDFPILGTGLGTYRYAYLPYQQAAPGVRYFNADNQYVEALLEGGWVGLGLMLTLGGLGLVCVASLVRQSRFELDPFAPTALFVVASQGIAALFDFGVSIPATALAGAVLMGSAAGRAAGGTLSRLSSKSRFDWSWPTRAVAFPPIHSAVLAGLVCCVGLTAGGWSLRELAVSSRAWRDRWDLPRLDTPESLADDQVEAAIARLEDDARITPDDPETHQALADLWIYRFRRSAFRAASAAIPTTSPKERQRLWDATDPLALARQSNVWAQKGQLERIQLLAMDSAVQESLTPAARHLEEARRGCAWLPWADLTLAMLRFVESPREPAAPEEIRRGLLVTPSNDALLYRAGLLAEASGDEPQALACWKRSLVLDPSRLAVIRPLVAQRLSLADQLARVYPDSPDFLLKLAADFYAPPGEADARYAIVDRALALVPDPRPDAPEANARRLQLLARGADLRDQPKQAADTYRLAVSAAPYNVEWRCELARLYGRQQEFKLALEQAEIAQALAPEAPQPRILLAELQKQSRLQSAAEPSPSPRSASVPRSGVSAAVPTGPSPPAQPGDTARTEELPKQGAPMKTTERVGYRALLPETAP